MAQTVRQGNHRATVFDPDEPIEGYKKKTWEPPKEWGPYVIRGEGKTTDKNGHITPMSLPYVVLYFEKPDTFVKRLVRACHGYDTIPLHQPEFNSDDLCR